MNEIVTMLLRLGDRGYFTNIRKTATGVVVEVTRAGSPAASVFHGYHLRLALSEACAALCTSTAPIEGRNL